ncbi:MAG TPA: hypothetical protein VN784_11020 [Candidatus Limnocylindrales bacterium]|nr:hypothetical protein [Candidatus Limnocylindrales bacterium]
MKMFYLIPLLFLSACSTTPKLTLRPQQPPATNADGIRYPEVFHTYHVGRYADPNDDLIMHEQHVVYRVEENTRWNLHPGPVDDNLPALPSRDAAFAPAPVNDAILAEVNSQRLATAQIMMQARTLSAALAQFQTALQQTKTNIQETLILRASVNEMKQRLDALESAPGQLPPPPISTTNEPPDPLSP